MKDSFTLDQVRRISLVVVVIGLIIGISGAGYSQQKVKRNIELILPIMICIMLFGLALSLPNAR